jgi:pimeloyl-ACP methyl ester carboxylesterase
VHHPTDSQPRHLVLVHGAWHGPWCWERVTPELEARGCVVDAVELPLSGYEDDIAHLRAALEAAVDGGRPVTVAAHSYGGMVATAACSGLDGIEHLVYVAAMMPARGEGVASIITRRRTLLADAIVVDEHTRTIDPARAPEVFYAKSTPEVAAAMTQRLRPMPPRGTEELVVEPAWATVPATYVLCEADACLHPETQREMATERAGRVIAIESDHCPFASDPALTAHLILSPAPG